MKYRYNARQPYTLEVSSPDRLRWHYLGNFKSIGNAKRRVNEFKAQAMLKPGVIFYVNGPIRAHVVR